MASTFMNLIDIWTLTISPEMRNNEFLDATPYREYWKINFPTYSKATKCNYETVYFYMCQVFYENNHFGVEEIYSNLPKVDRISPLLKGIRNDILERLFADDNLILEIINSGNHTQVTTWLNDLFPHGSNQDIYINEVLMTLYQKGANQFIKSAAHERLFCGDLNP